MIEHISQREIYEILVNIARKEIKKIHKLTRKLSNRESKNLAHHPVAHPSYNESHFL